jgi:hypothetical protein
VIMISQILERMSMESAESTYLSNKGNEVQEKSEPRSPYSTNGLERKLIESVAMVLPSLTEANVSEANGSPGEQGGETRDG